MAIRKRFNLMNETRKWIFHRISGIILAPLFFWFYFSLISLSDSNYQDATYFFENPLFKILSITLFFIGFFHAKISLGEIFEDYIHNKKIKDAANLLALILSIVIPLITLILLVYKI
ncbi:MAG: succinate dehydrogenase, hydrophobic membrane anchor protein [Candidatus Pelagibacterales bacterium]|nr:MAG: succinate dehydrogenase, hydrophobic membrane anchor protein [Pelagibacterales bacterium]